MAITKLLNIETTNCSNGISYGLIHPNAINGNARIINIKIFILLSDGMSLPTPIYAGIQTAKPAIRAISCLFVKIQSILGSILLISLGISISIIVSLPFKI